MRRVTAFVSHRRHGVGQKSGSTINSADAYSFKLDDIVDRLMEFNDTNVSSRLGGHVDGVEGFYTETLCQVDRYRSV